MQNKITSTRVRETKNYIKGIFTLSDKSKTKFEINKRTEEWYQWGNSTDNLCISVPKIEAIIYTFFHDEN